MPARQIRVLIVDDEKFAREGFRNLIPWENLGFLICAEAQNGEEAIDKIRLVQPDLVLLDVKLPDMTGTEVLRAIRRTGFQGEVIIISGYTDFQYAKDAMENGASSYLVKPVDGIELQAAAVAARDRIIRKGLDQIRFNQYFIKSREQILTDLLTGAEKDPMINYDDLGLTYSRYQVVIYEGYFRGRPAVDFGKLMETFVDSTGPGVGAGLSHLGVNGGNIEELRIDRHDVILLEGPVAVERFERWNRHLRGQVQQNSMMDSVFCAYGMVVSEPNEIYRSYDQCLRLIQRRLYCEENQHVLSYRELPENREQREVEESVINQYCERLFAFVRQRDRAAVNDTLRNIWRYFSENNVRGISARHAMIDILFQVRNKTLRFYGEAGKALFDTNTKMIETIETSVYFYEIVRYVSDVLERIMERAGVPSTGNVLDDVVRYIDDNYGQKLTLESIAPLFGYNSSYLGKILSEKLGCSFNTYLDRVRMERAKRMLTDTSMQIQDIAAAAGYRYIDSFNQKFRKSTGCSPSEWRRSHGEGSGQTAGAVNTGREQD